MITSDIIICLLTLFGIALAAMLVLFLALKRDMRVSVQKQRLQLDDLQAQFRAAVLESQLHSRVQSRPRMPPPSAVNISPRVKVARLLRRGEDPAQTAAALGVSRPEAELLARVHQIRSRQTIDALALPTHGCTFGAS